MLEACGKRSTLPKVAAKKDHSQARIGRLQARKHRKALVGAAIIDRDDFVRPSPPVQRARQFAVQLFERRRLVPDGDDDA